MLINFFYTLRAAKLPVSVKEYLTLLEALKAGVIDTSIDQFYFLARSALVKDEAHFDKFDRAFGAYFKGGMKPVTVWVSDDYSRAGPGGMLLEQLHRAARILHGDPCGRRCRALRPCRRARG